MVENAALLINKKTGAKGGQFANKYLERQDLELLGYSPTPIIGGDFMFTALPDKVLRTIPIAWDRFLNPAMMIFFFNNSFMCDSWYFLRIGAEHAPPQTKN